MAVAGPDQPQGQFRVDSSDSLYASPAVHDRPLFVTPAAGQAAIGLLPWTWLRVLSGRALGQQLPDAAIAEPELLEPMIRLAVVVMLPREPQRLG